MTVDQLCQLRQKLATDQRWLERAILAIDKRQTEDERREDQTKYLNNQGFTAADAKRGSYYARWIRGGQHLSGWHLKTAREMMMKYASQLLTVIEEKKQTLSS